MKHYYYFCDSITHKSINTLVSDLQGKELVELWFDTDGGHIDSMQFLIAFLNSRKDSIKITLVGELSSAGTQLLTDFEGEIIISDGLDYMMFHKVDRLSRTLREQMPESKKIIEQDVETNRVIAEKLSRIGLTTKEINKYNKGKDVVLYKKDFHRIILPQNRRI